MANSHHAKDTRTDLSVPRAFKGVGQHHVEGCHELLGCDCLVFLKPALDAPSVVVPSWKPDDKLMSARSSAAFAAFPAHGGAPGPRSGHARFVGRCRVCVRARRHTTRCDAVCPPFCCFGRIADQGASPVLFWRCGLCAGPRWHQRPPFPLFCSHAPLRFLSGHFQSLFEARRAEHDRRT